MQAIEDADVSGKRVIVRADLNVPMGDGKVTDATRIDRFLPTLQNLIERKAKVMVMAHFGRPSGGKPEPDFSLLPVTRKLAEILKENNLLAGKVLFAEDCVGTAAQKTMEKLEDGQVAVLENLRFHKGEKANDEEFAKELAALADIYVNDAFSVSHRAHASTHAIASLLPSYAGLSMKAELDALNGALGTPKRPLAAVIGGAKVSTKIPVLTNLTSNVDMLIIGGGMANTFLFANGVNVGKSLCEPDFVDTVKEIYANAEKNGCQILLPSDVVVAEEFKAGAASEVCDTDSVAEDGMILDVGPVSLAELKEAIGKCQTLIWNGPLGAFEIEPFGAGTFELAKEAARLTTEGKLITVAGGGDTVAALNMAGASDDFSYISTAGGAFLEWLEGRELPGVAALELGNKEQ
jgi:phosphoglycerate kinase